MGSRGHVVLVGLMGSGKTTVGRLVADRLGRAFVDSDTQVEERTGRTVRDIWRDEGEAAFRRLEAEALRAAVDIDDPAVIAAAGGAVLAAENRAVLERAGPVIWLHADPEVLAARAARGEHRPLLDADPVEALQGMAADRSSLYRSVADHVVDVVDRTPEDIASEIVDLVRAAP